MRWTAALVGLAILLAGCTNGEAGGQDSTELLFDETPVVAGKGLIRGIVVDPSIAPVMGALVALNGQAETTSTTAQGAFVFTDLEPGTYFLQVSKPGWTTVQQSTEVQANVREPPVVKVAMEKIPGAEPRAETVNLEGYLSCSVGTPLTLHDCNTVEEQRGALFFPIDGMPQWIQTEVTWESTQAAGDWLYIIQGVCECDGTSIASQGFDSRFDETAEATSPYIVRVDQDFLEANDVGGENREISIDVSASGPEPGTTNGSGIALNQRFQVYVTFFYNFEPDAGWTFVGDGPYPVPPA
jgi:hypothetical protein